MNHNNINGGEIVIAKFNYNAQENHELSIVKNERLVLLNDSCLWWKVKRVDSDDTGYIPSNFARREKRSLLDKIISKRINKKPSNAHGYHLERVLSLALVKFRYDAESEDEISLNKGVWVNVLDKKNDGWWLVQYDKQRGWFPSNYLIEKTNDGLNSLSLLNQLKHQHSSSSSTNGLSSSSSANSNIVETIPSHFVTQNRHNSHPAHITNSNDEYAFVIKPSKLAHSDGKLDSCLTFNNQQQKNSSWSALIQYDNTNSGYTSSSVLSHEPMTLIDGLTTITLNRTKSQPDESPFDNELWYYGWISRDEAEKYLKEDRTDRGDFLVRNSERKIGNYSLSIRADEGTIRHFRVESTDDGTQFLIGKRSFQSLQDLIEHYKTHPVFDSDQSSKLYLNQPLIIKNSNRRS